MKILTLNCGSSSLKFALWEALASTESALRNILRGSAEPIGKSGRLTLERESGEKSVEDLALPGYREAVNAAFDCLDREGVSDIAAIGHRVVHGGARLREP